jgi:hypothetical protein
MDVIIIDSIRTYMVQQTFTMITHAMMMAVQEKTQSYAERTPCDDFIPLAIETCECFHSCFDLFLTTCA